ncbi:MAG: hypothetical protein M3R04_07945 [bacterium]|nr:hypothetical protein [bacterium]
MAAQIAAIQQSLGMGQYLSQTQGKAGSGAGMGSTPYGAEPTPAPSGSKPENREGDPQQGDVNSEQYTGLYAPKDYASSAKDQRLQGKMDLTKPPEKVEEVRSAPEDQKALREYSGAVSAYADGEEEAISREQVPLEYQELVRQYFDEIKKDSKGR